MNEPASAARVMPETRAADNQRSFSVVALVLAAILPVSIALAFVIYLLNEEYRANTEEDLTKIVSEISAATDRDLAEALRLASSLAVSDFIRSADYDRFNAETRRLMTVWPHVASITLTDLATNTYLSHTSLPANRGQPAGSATANQSQVVAAERKPMIFPVRVSGPTVKESLIPIRVPIFDQAGQVTQVLSVTLSAAGLNQQFGRHGIKPEWTGALIGPDFTIAARNRSPTQFVGQRVTPSLEQGLIAKPHGLFKATNQEGQPVYTAFLRSPESGWTVVVGIPAADIESRRSQAMILVIAIGCIAALTGLVAALHVGRRIHRARMLERNLTRHLEDEVAKRTAELQRNEQLLHQAQKMEAVGKLTSGIAHDFNNLLGVVIGNLDLILEGLSDRPKLVPRVTQSIEAAERGAALVQQLLAFSRKQTLQPQAIELASLIRRTAEMLRHTLGEQIKLVVDCDRPLRPCFADPGQVESAIINLAINARDAMPKGGTLTISARNVELDTDDLARRRNVAKGAYVMLAVTDTGTGMAPDVLARAVEPFFTTKDTGKGSGLGLSMVYGLATQSRGFFDLRSEPGHGTTVEIGFPVAASGAPAWPAQAPPASTPAPAPRGGSGPVLLVEDNPRLRATTAAMLRQIGYEPLEAGSADEALAVLARHPEVDLMVSDVILPGHRNGFELAAEAIRLRPQLRALHVSGFANVDTLAGETSRGAIHLLNKPFRTEDLARAIAAIELRRTA
ncbi:MAG: ATP-binding protein [Alphaproteobacteria bacterium]